MPCVCDLAEVYVGSGTQEGLREPNGRVYKIIDPNRYSITKYYTPGSYISIVSKYSQGIVKSVRSLVVHGVEAYPVHVLGEGKHVNFRRDSTAMQHTSDIY